LMGRCRCRDRRCGLPAVGTCFLPHGQVANQRCCRKRAHPTQRISPRASLDGEGASPGRPRTPHLAFRIVKAVVPTTQGSSRCARTGRPKLLRCVGPNRATAGKPSSPTKRGEWRRSTTGP
jgi:hypothetical protein